MRYRAWCASLLGVVLLLILSLGSAHAQATRTWVSGVGDDANPCSRTAPCKTFAGAISKTAAGGEISVLDPGGFGAVTITKSISIIQMDSGEAGVLASGTTGIIVNAAATDVVVLRGLVIDGGTPAVPGLHGIRFLAGAALHVENCLIKGFRSTSAGAGNGILFAPNATAELYVSRTTLLNNGSASTGSGIVIAPTGAGKVTATLQDVQLENNRIGVSLNSTGGTATINAAVNNSTVVGTSGQGLVVTTAAAGGIAATAIINNSVMSNNVGTALVANGNAAVIRVGGSIITGNMNAVNAANGGTVTSYKNNLVDGNNNNNTPIPQSVLN